MGDQTSDQLRCALGRLRAGDGDASTSSDGGHEQLDNGMPSDSSQEQTIVLYEGAAIPDIFQLTQSLEGSSSSASFHMQSPVPVDSNVITQPNTHAVANMSTSYVSNASVSNCPVRLSGHQIENLMERSAVLLEQQEEENQRRAERVEQSRRILRVPGDISTTSDALSDDDIVTLKKLKTPLCDIAQVPSNVPVVGSYPHRDAALTTTESDNSEPYQLIPGTKYKSTKVNRKVPVLKTIPRWGTVTHTNLNVEPLETDTNCNQERSVSDLSLHSSEANFGRSGSPISISCSSVYQEREATTGFVSMPPLYSSGHNQSNCGLSNGSTSSSLYEETTSTAATPLAMATPSDSNGNENIIPETPDESIDIQSPSLVRSSISSSSEQFHDCSQFLMANQPPQWMVKQVSANTDEEHVKRDRLDTSSSSSVDGDALSPKRQPKKRLKLSENEEYIQLNRDVAKNLARLSQTRPVKSAKMESSLFSSSSGSSGYLGGISSVSSNVSTLSPSVSIFDNPCIESVQSIEVDKELTSSVNLLHNQFQDNSGILMLSSEIDENNSNNNNGTDNSTSNSNHDAISYSSTDNKSSGTAGGVGGCTERSSSVLGDADNEDSTSTDAQQSNIQQLSANTTYKDNIIQPVSSSSSAESNTEYCSINVISPSSVVHTSLCSELSPCSSQAILNESDITFTNLTFSGTQHSFHLHLSPSQSEPDTKLLSNIGSCTVGSTIVTTGSSEVTTTTPPSTDFVITSLTSCDSSCAGLTSPPFPVYESVQLSNSETNVNISNKYDKASAAGSPLVSVLSPVSMLQRTSTNLELTNDQDINSQPSFSKNQVVASGHNSSMDIEKSPWMKSFVLCTDSSQPIIDDDHFNDSSHFELPLITAINEKESETPLVDFNIHCTSSISTSNECTVVSVRNSYSPSSLFSTIRPIPASRSATGLVLNNTANPFEFESLPVANVQHSLSQNDSDCENLLEIESQKEETARIYTPPPCNPLYSSTPPCSTSCGTSVQNCMLPVSHTSTVSSPHSTDTSLFVSPKSCLNSKMLNELSFSHPQSPFVCLQHITSVAVMKVHKYVCTEIIDKSTGEVVECRNEIVTEDCPQEKKFSIKVNPLVSLPSATTPHTFSPVYCHAPMTCTVTSTTNHSNSISMSEKTVDSLPPIKSMKTGKKSLLRKLSKAAKCVSSDDNYPGKKRSKSEKSPFSLTIGQRVVARWRNGYWYAATVTSVLSHKVHVEYFDGDHSNVSLQNILPLASLPVGVPVTVIDTNQLGTFVDNSESSFRLRQNDGSIITCSLESLMMTNETALMSIQMINTVNNEETPSEISSLATNQMLFSGLTFLVTYHRRDNNSTESSAVGALSRKKIEDLIHKGGGIIMGNYTPNMVVYQHTFCLSDTYCRTPKYLISLAVNIPTVSYEWIDQCVKQNKLLDYIPFLLPSGFSTYTQTLVQWKPRASDFLKFVSIHIVASPSFKEFWEKIISSGGGNIINKLPTSSYRKDSQSNVIVVCEEGTLPLTIRLQYRVVAAEWLMECLLLGQLV